MTNGQGGYEPGRLTKNKSQKLPQQRVQWFLERIKELEFWTLPPTEKIDAEIVRLDGAEWIIEGVRDGTYRIVDRWSPEKGPIRVLGLIMLFDLAKLRLLFQEVY